MSKPDGGPAFPCEAEVWLSNTEHPRWVTQNVSGMSLRDYFAGQALAGLLARSSIEVPHCGFCRPVGNDAGEHYADIAYRYADAMLAEREKD
jgi:hypothetical protein